MRLKVAFFNSQSQSSKAIASSTIPISIHISKSWILSSKLLNDILEQIHHRLLQLHCDLYFAHFIYMLLGFVFRIQIVKKTYNVRRLLAFKELSYVLFPWLFSFHASIYFLPVVYMLKYFILCIVLKGFVL